MSVFGWFSEWFQAQASPPYLVSASTALASMRALERMMTNVPAQAAVFNLHMV